MFFGLEMKNEKCLAKEDGEVLSTACQKLFDKRASNFNVGLANLMSKYDPTQNEYVSLDSKEKDQSHPHICKD